MTRRVYINAARWHSLNTTYRACVMNGHKSFCWRGHRLHVDVAKEMLRAAKVHLEAEQYAERMRLAKKHKG